MAVPPVRSHLRKRACTGAAGRVGAVTTDQPTRNASETAAAAASFLEGQEITTTDCPQCGTQLAGIKGRYSCGSCGWSNPWYEGHGTLPTAEDDPDWPGRKAKAS